MKALDNQIKIQSGLTQLQLEVGFQINTTGMLNIVVYKVGWEIPLVGMIYKIWLIIIL